LDVSVVEFDSLGEASFLGSFLCRKKHAFAEIDADELSFRKHCIDSKELAIAATSVEEVPFAAQVICVQNCLEGAEHRVLEVPFLVGGGGWTVFAGTKEPVVIGDPGMASPNGFANFC
jgi:hypothetical protein